MQQDTNTTCPRCGGGIPNDLYRGQYPGALSRVDNATEICSDCGFDEAMEAMNTHKPLSWAAMSGVVETIGNRRFGVDIDKDETDKGGYWLVARAADSSGGITWEQEIGWHPTLDEARDVATRWMIVADLVGE